MSHQPYYRESEESSAENDRRTILLPGQEICDCGEVIELEERRKCIHCGYRGCVHCMHWVEDTGEAEVDGDWVCGEECEVEWLQSLAQSEDRSHRLYQDWMAKRIRATRSSKTE